MDKQASLIDITDESQVLDLARTLHNLSTEYAKHRRESAKYQYKLDVILAELMPEFRKVRNSIGYETARLMLLEPKEDDTNADEIKEYYSGYLYHTAKYKGLEKVLDSLKGQISLIQSLIKNRREET